MTNKVNDINNGCSANDLRLLCDNYILNFKNNTNTLNIIEDNIENCCFSLSDKDVFSSKKPSNNLFVYNLAISIMHTHYGIQLPHDYSLKGKITQKIYEDTELSKNPILVLSSLCESYDTSIKQNDDQDMLNIIEENIEALYNTMLYNDFKSSKVNLLVHNSAMSIIKTHKMIKLPFNEQLVKKIINKLPVYTDVINSSYIETTNHKGLIYSNLKENNRYVNQNIGSEGIGSRLGSRHFIKNNEINNAENITTSVLDYLKSNPKRTLCFTASVIVSYCLAGPFGALPCIAVFGKEVMDKTHFDKHLSIAIPKH